ncbi:MAG: TrkA family potassium uptake protein [Atopobiaceae bacterium]|jgi:trk system potassium uptake protein TrkA|nr:TrkA family potassium uptake protein [Atopobiaceae bacterium]
MNVIIVGLGRMGSGLANRLSKQGTHVIAIDKDPLAFDNLDPDFTGEKVQGVGFDHDVLRRSGIERASALVACTASDEANIVVAHVARSVYRVPRVIARLYDTAKADTYRRLDIQTVSTTDWGIRRAAELLTYHQLDTVYGINHDGVRLVRADVPTLLEGKTVRELTSGGRDRHLRDLEEQRDVRAHAGNDLRARRHRLCGRRLVGLRQVQLHARQDRVERGIHEHHHRRRRPDRLLPRLHPLLEP